MEPALLTLTTPREMGLSLARRLRELRLLKVWTRETLAARAGVSAASLKRFETQGKASLDLVLRVAHALGRLNDFAEILQLPPAAGIAELERRAAKPLPKRGRV